MAWRRPRTAEGWKKMCLGKKRFRTQDFADKIARKWGQRSYFCPFCSGFHCTKNPGTLEGFQTSREAARPAKPVDSARDKPAE